jgi:hypothetical protein
LCIDLEGGERGKGGEEVRSGSRRMGGVPEKGGEKIQRKGGGMLKEGRSHGARERTKRGKREGGGIKWRLKGKIIKWMKERKIG